MAVIGGGLHDDDRPPYSAVEAEVHAKWREWGFWTMMSIGLWAAFQGQSMTAFWFTAVLILVFTIKIIAGPIASEIKKTWNS